MTTYLLRARQRINRPLDETFAFFARPENLARLTPPALGFELRSIDTRMRDGLELAYRVRPLLGIPTGWRSLIQDYEPPHRLTDIQLAGPYRAWEHRHLFVEVDGVTEVTDEVRYALPLGPLGDLAHRLVVRSELPHPIESLLARIVVLAERHVSGAGMLEYARALAARCGGMVFDERGAAIEVTLEQPRATLVVVPSPQPGNGHWPGRYAELIVRCCAAPVLFIPGFSEGATS